jgi:hypothetical protein
MSFFMFGHVPRGAGPLLERIHDRLRPGVASFDADTNRRLLAAAGFELVRDRVVRTTSRGTAR